MRGGGAAAGYRLRPNALGTYWMLARRHTANRPLLSSVGWLPRSVGKGGVPRTHRNDFRGVLTRDSEVGQPFLDGRDLIWLNLRSLNCRREMAVLHLC